MEKVDFAAIEQNLIEWQRRRAGELVRKAIGPERQQTFKERLMSGPCYEGIRLGILYEAHPIGGTVTGRSRT
jgi:hypothetical protein